MELGDTFLNLDPGSPRHLWIVIAKSLSDDSVVIVNFTDAENIEDDACLVRPGEHPFVQKLTAVNYQRAKILPLGVQTLIRQRGLVEAREALLPDMPDLFDKIQLGALKSELIPRAIQNFLRQNPRV